MTASDEIRALHKRVNENFAAIAEVKDRIYTALVTLNATVAAGFAKCGPCGEVLVGIRTDVDFLKTAIKGNGKPGLENRVDRLEQARQTDTDRRTERWHWFELAIGVAGTLVTSAGGGILWWLMR